jgi:hypothetical protein
MKLFSLKGFVQGISLLILWATALTTSLSAQMSSKPILCGNEIFHDILERHYPALLENINNTFDEAKARPRERRSDPLQVNVVVHVIWNDAAENLEDSIIQSQMQVLNIDFNKLNDDTSNLRPLFQSVAGNANIHFNLASIVRVHTDQLFSVDLLGTNLLAEVKHDADGGSDAWDPNAYINIWVCKIQPIVIFGLEVGQLFGFSFPPNNLPNWPADNGAPTPGEDGLVIDYRVFGANNPNTIVVPGTTDLLAVNGRTPVHEMGHYLGLRHIWGDGGLLGPNDCAQSDGIDDTPYANAQSNFDCDKTKNTCAQTEPFYNADVPDLIENYMDYSSEDCMNMFTKGQVDLMRNVLLGPRVTLITDPAAVHDVSDQSAMSIYPNPADDLVTIKLESADEQIRTVRILDLNGKVIFRWLAETLRLPLSAGNLPANDQKLEVSDLPSGIYVVEAIGLKSAYAAKVVIQ